MNIIKAFQKAFINRQNRNWEFIYIFVDLHDTVLYSNYSDDEIPNKFFPYAKEALQKLTMMKQVKLIMYTCSHPSEIKKYEELFLDFGIIFDYVNENPEVLSMVNSYGCYDSKPYMNVLLEDKSGFSGDDDWKPILDYLDTPIAYQTYLKQPLANSLNRQSKLYNNNWVTILSERKSYPNCHRYFTFSEFDVCYSNSEKIRKYLASIDN